MGMHPSARRLFDAILTTSKVDGYAEPGKVATLLGVSPATITNWKSRGVSKDGALLAEKKLGIRPMYISDGIGDLPSATRRPAQNVTLANFRAKVPLISWVQAGAPQGVEDVFQPGQADVYEDVFEASVSGSAFALRVVGDSMVSPLPGALSFPEGTILIVDPGRTAGAGDYVIAKDVSTQQATFKKLAHDAGRWFLRPLNPAYPTMEIDDPALRIIGKVVEYSLRGRLP